MPPKKTVKRHCKVPKQAVIVHSGGMDSTLCLALALREFPKEQLISLSFSYHQRHSNELQAARKICADWGVEHKELNLSVLSLLTKDALTDSTLPIEWEQGSEPTTLVVGRNGLMARLAAIHAHSLGARCIYMGLMEIESHYRDCSEEYIRLKEKILRMDLADEHFEIRTPLIHMRKEETMELAHSMGILDYLLENTISCYEGISGKGCTKCPACFLRNRGLEQFYAKHKVSG